MKNIVLLLACLATTGCASVATAQRLTAGATGCRPDDVVVTNLKQPGTSAAIWEATCKEKKYICSFSITTQCTAAQEP